MAKYEEGVDQNDIQAAISAGIAIGATGYKEINGAQFAIVPAGIDLKNLTAIVREAAGTPKRIVAHPVFTEAASFAAYVDAFQAGYTGSGNSETTRLFGSVDKARICGVIDYHGGDPSWATHKATLALQLSPEWWKT